MTPSTHPTTRQVHLVEFTMLPGNRYSATLGYLQAAAQAEPDLAAALTFHRHVSPQFSYTFDRECAKVMATLDDPLVVAFTIYFWNRPAAFELARRVKERWPACQIVIGGNDVTNQQDAVFAEAPWVDVLVHGEGELRFTELLRRFLHAAQDHAPATPLADMLGISHRSPTGEVVTTPPAERIADLAVLPSPILSSVYTDADLAATQVIVYETNRGCPYSCAFCYWGGATNSKVRQFPLDRIEAELDRLIRLAPDGAQIFIADANFGIVARDAEITRILIDTCRRYRKRIIVQTNWAKNTSDRVVTIAHQLHSAGLSAAITLSAQSFDPAVLQIAKRSNIRVSTYRRMQERFRELSVPTYTDLIWGLPGETPQSYHDGIEEVLGAGGSVVIYPLLLLNNTEYTKDRYRTEHEMQVRHLPCQPGVTELAAEMVVAHSAMSYQEWVDGMMLRLSLCVFQKALFRCTLRILGHHTGVRIVDLCERLVTYLDSACSDPHVRAIARNHAECWRDPDAYDRSLITKATGPRVIGEELHYQGLVARFVREPLLHQSLAAEAIDYLLTGLGATSGRLRRELDAVMSLDLAAAALLRANLIDRTESNEFRISGEALAVLREYADIPAEMTTPEGILSVPAARARYPFSPYYLAVWHGSGRPLHDLVLSATEHEHILETA